jgi:hypothetical protein
VEKFQNIPVSERPFVITHADDSAGSRSFNTTIHIADSGHTSMEMGRYKLDILFVSPNLDTSIVKEIMDVSKLRFNGMKHEQIMAPQKCSSDLTKRTTCTMQLPPSTISKPKTASA